MGIMSLEDLNHALKYRAPSKQRQIQRTKYQKTRKLPRLKVAVPPPNNSLHHPPGADFFNYVNGPWLRSVHVPPYISSYGISEEVEAGIDKMFSGLVTECVEYSELPELGAESYMQKTQRFLGKLSHSVLNTPDQQNSIKSLKNILRRLECMRDHKDIATTLGEVSRYKVHGLFWIYGQYENTRAKKYTMTIGVGAIGLPDISYYAKTAPGKGRTLLHYSTMLRRISALLDIPDMSSVIPIETILANTIQKSLTEDSTLMKGAALQADFPDIPWDAFFAGMGIHDWKNMELCIDSKNWLRTVQKLFRWLPMDNWRLLFSTQIVLHLLRFLPPPFDDIHFEFFRKSLRGQTEKTPQKMLTLDVLEDWATPFISRLFVERLFDKNIKKQAKEFVNELKVAAQERLLHTEWLQPATRKAAAEKVDKMTASVGFPDSFYALKIPRVDSHNLVENLLQLGEWRTEYELSREGEKRESQRDWDDAVFSVNAYYYEQGNEIVIPAGQLYWPFYRLDAPLGWNYGGLGCILGHEMTHAFDIDGKEYDQNGMRKKWWSGSDNRAYNTRTRALIKLFDTQKVLGHAVSGTLTLSENISDLGGMAIALDALKARFEKIKASEAVRKEAYRQFFIAYAVSWRTKEKPAKTIQGLFLDRHAPPQFRVNLIVSQFQEWYDAFNIQPRDKLYTPVEDRIRIF